MCVRECEIPYCITVCTIQLSAVEISAMSCMSYAMSQCQLKNQSLIGVYAFYYIGSTLVQTLCLDVCGGETVCGVRKNS